MNTHTGTINQSTPNTLKLFRWGTFVISLTLYLAACALPALTQDAPGIFLLVSGWLGIFQGVYAWLANPLLALAWIFLLAKKHALAACFGILALGFGIPALQETELCADFCTTSQPMIGTYFWLAAMCVAVIGALAALVIHHMIPTTADGTIPTQKFMGVHSPKKRDNNR